MRDNIAFGLADRQAAQGRDRARGRPACSHLIQHGGPGRQEARPALAAARSSAWPSPAP
ncbi:MAG: hypothetical protein MZU84_06305 [Sphingobacterium sp.]|nr:hypothetical protein [Sphingobacterium sp.]